jgi:hypothetical protein
VSGTGTQGGRAGKGRWMAIALGVLGLLLAANLAVSLLGMDEAGEPAGFLTPDIVRGVGFWVPVGLVFAASLAALAKVEKNKDRRDARGIKWMRGSFVFAIAGGGILAWATQEAALFPREDLIIVAAWIFGLQVLLLNRLIARQFEDHAAPGTKRKRKARPAPPAVAADSSKSAS